ncbi:MAG: ergothioneine biosynthesis protein EgtB [Terracidiphilus sp.]
MSTSTPSFSQGRLAARFRHARRQTLDLCKPLTPEDMMVQSCPEASPAKWHLAHTTWFFESFILREFSSGYQPFHPDFHWLFNSYYRSFAQFPEKRLRASFSRPALDEILRYRAHVDAAMDRLLESTPPADALNRIELGIHHEEQHQELLLTDILNAFYANPLHPAYLPAAEVPAPSAEPLRFLSFSGGLVECGHTGSGFSFDNELPRHRVWLAPYTLASRLVTNAEFAQFIADGGYQRPEFWLSAGWDAVQQNAWRAPLYWTDRDEQWRLFTLRGSIPLAAAAQAPVAHVSFYEADAYARWSGHRLPTEFEWEAAASVTPVQGNLLDSGHLAPQPTPAPDPGHIIPQQIFGDCWEWTASAYLGYPGFRPLPGSLGEYNGKFMSGQMVLRGGSCVTPAAHIRRSYRNFFAPETRWQFSGIRLAKM